MGNIEQSVDTLINGQWTLKLPPIRAQRPGWEHWEYERLASMYAAIRLGDTVIDVGTEEGDLSALFAHWIGERGNMILIEPSPKMWPNIKQTWDLNNLPKPLAMFAGFAENHVNDLGINLYDWPSYCNLPIEPEPGFRHLNEDDPEIARITIDEMVERLAPPRVDIINIDVEGAEFEVMLGAEKTLATYRPTVYISVHPQFMYDRYRHTSDDLLVHMQKYYHYNAFYLGYDHEAHYCFKPQP